ncbi:MAG: 50S ribosomal protein L17 [Pirellulaceae bacterium]|nr:50S ribosomal protein L17 [Pirellulaceae bacterium]
MRHRRKGRTLGRAPSHRKSLLRNMASALILTERDAEFDPNPPKVPGRIVTTLEKAKEVRPLVEKCVTIARRSLEAQRRAAELASTEERDSEAWRVWRKSDAWKEWVDAQAPVVAARRRVHQLLQDKEAVSILFDTIAPRFEDRPGGYTRVLRLPKPRLGDGGTQAILEFVGIHDRTVVKSEKPAFATDDEQEEAAAVDEDDDVAETETVSGAATSDLEASADDSSAEDSAPEDDAEKKADE